MINWSDCLFGFKLNGGSQKSGPARAQCTHACDSPLCNVHYQSQFWGQCEILESLLCSPSNFL